MIRRVLAVLGCALLVTGCYRSDFGVTVNDDGSGTVDIVLAVDPERLQQLSEQFGDDSGLGDDPCAQIRDESQTAEDLPEGAEVEPYEEDGFCGVRVRASFEAGTDIGSFVLDDLQFGSTSTDDSPVVFETFVIERDGEGWRFDATTASTSDSAGIDSGMLESFLDDASNTVRVKLPGGVIEDDADRREDGALVWDLDLLGSSRTMHARTGPGGGDDDGGSAVLWIVLGVVAVAAVVVVVLLWRRSRSRKPPTGGASGPGTAPGWGDASAGDGSGGTAATVPIAPPETDAAATAPGVGAATAGATAPGAGPQWDPQRQAYIQWDPAGGRWLQYDDAAKEWKALG